MAFVVITMVAVMLSGIFLFKAGKLTSEKMQLQNAADAVAYSVSTLEARDLNFSSYMNRAMVANEVAIGQLVGLVSWADHLASVGKYLKFYNHTFLMAPTLGASSFLDGIATAFTAVGSAIKVYLLALPGISRTRTHFLSRLNGYYGYAQVAFHGTTTMLMVSTIEDLVRNNSPGAQLSDFGFVSLLGHLHSYSNKFTTTFNPQSRTLVNKGGYERFAAMVDASTDPFTRKRGFQASVPGFPQTQCVDITGALRPFMPGIVLTLLDSALPKGCVDIDMRLDRLGGSELRYLAKIGAPDVEVTGGINVDISGGFDPGFTGGVDLGLTGGITGSIDPGITVDPSLGGSVTPPALSTCTLVPYPGLRCPKGHGDRYNWSAADNTAFNLDLTFTVDFPRWINKFGVSDIRLDLPALGAPFASGVAENGLAGFSGVPFAISLDAQPKSLGGPVPADAYGGAPNSLAPWMFKYGVKPKIKVDPPTPDAVTKVIVDDDADPINVAGNIWQFNGASTHINKLLNIGRAGYEGLPQYTDVTKTSPGWGYEAPYFIAGLTKSISRVNNTDPTSPDYRAGSATLPTGRLALTDAAADNEIAAVAKSEVYFLRPTDSAMAAFHRTDGKKEAASAFNPYWQARLVDTSYADRVVGLLLQQQQAWDPALATRALPQPITPLTTYVQ